MKSLNSLQPLGLLALRVALGLIFFSHGYPKLAHQGAGMQNFFVQHGLPGYFVYIAGVLEVFAPCCWSWACLREGRRCSSPSKWA